MNTKPNLRIVITLFALLLVTSFLAACQPSSIAPDTLQLTESQEAEQEAVLEEAPKEPVKPYMVRGRRPALMTECGGKSQEQFQKMYDNSTLSQAGTDCMNAAWNGFDFDGDEVKDCDPKESSSACKDEYAEWQANQ